LDKKNRKQTIKIGDQNGNTKQLNKPFGIFYFVSNIAKDALSALFLKAF
jgi:hypothetical protein